MKYIPKNTLAYFNAFPHLQRHDLSSIPTEVFGKATAEYRKTCGTTSPNEDALTFYALNHCAAVVKKSFTLNEPLPEWAQHVLDAYGKAVTEQSKRMLHYIITIATREMRHWDSHGHFSAADWKHIEAAGTSKMVDFIKLLSESTEDAGAKKYMTMPPKVGIGPYLKAMAAGFHKANNQGWGGGYGGTAWGLVTDAAVAAIYGQTSLADLVDTGYTLAHNGGPIFNKGMMYDHWGPSLHTILDVQAAGQTPELVLDPESYNVVKPDAVKSIVKLVQAEKPNEFRGYVDWFQVVAKAGPYAPTQKKLYDQYQKKQKVKHPKTAAAAVQKITPKVLHGEKIKVVGEFAVYPGQTVEIYQRVS